MKNAMKMKTKNGAFIGSLFLSVLCFGICGTAPVFAGFEWKSSPAKTMLPKASAPAENEAPPASLPAQNIQSVESAPLALTTAPPPASAAPPMATQTAPSAASNIENNDTVVGFGEDMPLAIALQQIAPAGYQFSFARGVNPGQSVSWQGGKGWQDVLHDTLQSRALDYRLQNGIVTIVPSAALPPLPLAQTKEKAPAQPATGWADRFFAGAPKEKVPSFADTSMDKPQPSSKDNDFEERRAMLDEDIRRHEQEAHMTKTKPEQIEWSNDLREEELAPLPLSRSAARQMAAPPAYLSPMPGDAAANPELMPARIEPNWMAPKGRSLRTVLKDWSEKEGVDLYWSIDYDYILNSDASYGGSYEEAVTALLDRFSNARPQPYGELHKKGPDSEVLIINSYDIYD